MKTKSTILRLTPEQRLSRIGHIIEAVQRRNNQITDQECRAIYTLATWAPVRGWR